MAADTMTRNLVWFGTVPVRHHRELGNDEDRERATAHGWGEGAGSAF